MIRKRPVFSNRSCESCRICMQACPISCISMTGLGKHGKYRNVFPEIALENCIGCGMCAAACPMKCIAMEEIP